MASTKDRQRALERARYERVQGKIQQKRREAQRRTRIAIVSTVVAVVVAGGLTLAFVPGSSSKTSTGAAAAATGSPSAAASASPSAASDPMAYVPYPAGQAKPAKPGIGVPSFDAAAAEKTYTVTLQTNQGNIVAQMDGKAAPYTVYSFVYLADKNYFDNTKCHRLTTSGIYVLQCGDPTGTGQGGPGYTVPDENLASLGSGATATYKAGTIAMANTGAPHSGGSQFFLVYKDSPLPPKYTPFGTITQGMDLLNQIAAKGSNNASGQGDGAPNEPVQIEKVTIAQG